MTMYAKRPAIKPQKAPPIPNRLMFAADTKNVINAASLVFTSDIAFDMLPAIVPSNAKPASMAMNEDGNAINNPTNVTPKIPTSEYRMPQVIPATNLFLGFSWVSLPVAMAAVIAAMLKGEDPKAKLILLAAPKAVGYYPKIGMTQWEQCYVLDNVEDLK